MTISEMPEGSICHIEIYASDLSETMLFYSDLFGWDVRTAMNGYGMWKDSSGNEGGFSTSGKPNETGCTVYIKVDNMENSIAKLKERDTEIVQEKTLIAPDFGFYSLFLDPSGNIIGLWSKK
jgi:uncharacterized protein